MGSAQKPQPKRSGRARKTTPLYPLWFGTNRQPVDSHNYQKGFSNKRDNRLHYGTCQVAVPKSHKIGETGSPWWKRLLQCSDDRLQLDKGSLTALAEIEFWSSVRQALRDHADNERIALVFIHGYNVSFEESAIRAAQIGCDLQVPGITAFYSWPSQGSFTGYPADAANIEASEPYLTRFLTHFAQDSGADRVHIIAHSMGNRGLLRSMQQILQQAQVMGTIPFGQIFLAAPDVDSDVFENLAGAYPNLAQRTTLYVSSKDKALHVSGILHDYPRAGYYPPVTVLPGIDTVEVSNIDMTFLGHGYYADARDLLSDIHALLMHDESPDKRFGLQEDYTEDGKLYWVIKP